MYTTLYSCHEWENKRPNTFLQQTPNMFVSAALLGVSTWSLMGLTHFWSRPRVVIQGTAAFGTSTLASFFSAPEILAWVTHKLHHVKAESRIWS